MSSAPFSSRTVANSLSRSALFEASPATVVTPSPIKALALSNSLWRRPVMKTYAPSSNKPLCGRQPDTAAAAGDHSDLAIQSRHQFYPPISSCVVDVLMRRPLLRQRCCCAEIVVGPGIPCPRLPGQPWGRSRRTWAIRFWIFPGCLVLDDIPMLGEQTVFEPHDVCRYPVGGLPDLENRPCSIT